MNDLSTNTDGPAPTGWAAKIAELTPATFMGRDCADLAEKYRQVRGISLGLPGRPSDATGETGGPSETVIGL